MWGPELLEPVWDHVSIVVMCEEIAIVRHVFGVSTVLTSVMCVQGMECIAALDSEAFHRYLDETQNTICGRHPIAVLIAVSSTQAHCHEPSFKLPSPPPPPPPRIIILGSGDSQVQPARNLFLPQVCAVRPVRKVQVDL